MTVYFAQMGSSGPIKIGVVRRGDIASRLKNLQMACPEELTLLGTIEGAGEQERWIHARFSESRLRGEWFSPSEYVLAEIKRLISGEILPPGIKPKNHMEVALTRAIERIGGGTALARALGITPQAVDQWRICPPHWLLKIEDLTGVSKEELRPDMCPEPKQVAPAAAGAESGDSAPRTAAETPEE